MPIHLSDRRLGKEGGLPARADGAFRSHSPFISSTSSRESIFSSPTRPSPLPSLSLGKEAPGREEVFSDHSLPSSESTHRMLFILGVTFSYSMDRTIASEAGGWVGGEDPSLMAGGGDDGWLAGGNCYFSVQRGRKLACEKSSEPARQKILLSLPVIHQSPGGCTYSTCESRHHGAERTEVAERRGS